MGSESIVKSNSNCFPPGFRFHPTDEELVLYYLKRKICRRSVKLDIIGEVDVYKWEPEELPGQSKLKSGDRQWFFFCPRDRRYPNGGRSSRATMHGYWKATGKDRTIKYKSYSAGIKKTLVYYLGRAPSGQRTDWVMHEYTMDEEALKQCHCPQEYFALCKVFKKSGPGPKNGEQYGAPFLAEEWSDDDYCFDVVGPVSVENAKAVPEEKPVFSDDILQFLNKIVVGNENSLVDLPHEASETTLLNVPEPHPEPEPVMAKEDFLEMNDLTGPQPVTEDQQFTSFGGFSDFDFCHESTGLYEMASFETQPEYGTEVSGFHTYSDNSVSEVVNHDISSDLWNFEQDNCTFVPAQTTHEAISQPSSGTVMVDGDGANSWFSSALWAFVDSIPTTPASASESTALVNKALERVSSFSGRCRNVNEAAAAAAGLSVSSSRGMVCFSAVVVLFAVLCAVFLGTSSQLLGGCVS